MRHVRFLVSRFEFALVRALMARRRMDRVSIRAPKHNAPRYVTLIYDMLAVSGERFIVCILFGIATTPIVLFASLSASPRQVSAGTTSPIVGDPVTPRTSQPVRTLPTVTPVTEACVKDRVMPPEPIAPLSRHSNAPTRATISLPAPGLSPALILSSDGISFTNSEYFALDSKYAWFTRIGTFRMPTCQSALYYFPVIAK